MMYLSIYHPTLGRDAQLLPHTADQFYALEHGNSCGSPSAVPDAVHQSRMLAEFVEGVMPAPRIGRTHQGR